MTIRIDKPRLNALLQNGRRLVFATLHERHDYLVDLGRGLRRPVRDVSREPEHWTRSLLKSSTR